MQQLHASIHINAPRAHVWDIMLGEQTYPEWACAFNPGSYFKGSWELGAKILFLGPSPDGNGEGGMVSHIKEHRLHEYISIEHIGMIQNGVEDMTSEEVKKWTPFLENYTFKDIDGGTGVLVDMDVNEEYRAMFEELWPKALLLLKALAEK